MAPKKLAEVQQDANGKAKMLSGDDANVKIGKFLSGDSGDAAQDDIAEEKSGTKKGKEKEKKGKKDEDQKGKKKQKPPPPPLAHASPLQLLSL